MTNNLTIICHCHNNYNDIWEPYFNNIFQLPFKKIIAVNKDSFLKKLNKDLIIEYDESIPFAQRMLYILNYVETKYIIYIQDNFIPVSYDYNKINICVEWLNTNNYDGLQLYINNCDSNTDNLIKITDDIYTYYNSVISYPYSVHPSIWNKESLINIFINHKNSIYRNIELDVSNYVNNNFKVFRLANIGKTIQTNGCKLLPFFQYIHIINFRYFNHYDDFADLRETYLKLIDDYKLDMTKRRMRKWDEPL